MMHVGRWKLGSIWHPEVGRGRCVLQGGQVAQQAALAADVAQRVCDLHIQTTMSLALS